MKNNWTKLGLMLIGLFAIAMAGTFVSDLLKGSGWFGDTPCGNFDECKDGNRYYRCGSLLGDKSVSWGGRHYLWSWMTSIMFILGLARIIFFIATSREKDWK